MVGYSVQFHHIDKLPEIRKPLKSKKFLIGDSIEGWADAINILIKSYFGINTFRPDFNYSDIRVKGARLITAGGKAPGPGPLRTCITEITNILDNKRDGEKLTPLECHDILCHIANSVLAGGIRRSAMIALFSFDDKEMLECKYGRWYELNEQRGRANNSTVIIRSKIKEEEFNILWNKIKLSGSGEPGIYFSHDKDWGTNPCCEIALRPFQFCNLCEINVNDVIDQNDLEDRAKVAAFFGTLQAGFTNFHYLRNIWRKTTEKDALIGVGMTGIASGKVLNLDLKKAADEVRKQNNRISLIIGINNAARHTTVKPSGTTSCVLGTSSGIHAWHNTYYIRRIRVMKNDNLYIYLLINHPELIEDDVLRSHDTAIISIPQCAPKGSILRTESALELLERVKKFNKEWVKEGHQNGSNMNNVSATISIKEDEWDLVRDWMWEHKKTFNGLSVLPYDNGSYVQAPFEDCTEEKYNEMIKHLKDLDLSKVVEMSDETDLQGEAACAGGLCSI